MEQEPKLDPSTITDVETAKLALRWAVEKIHGQQEELGRLREDNRTKTSINRSLTEQVEQKTEILKKWQGTIKTWEENWKTLHDYVLDEVERFPEILTGRIGHYEEGDRRAVPGNDRRDPLFPEPMDQVEGDTCLHGNLRAPEDQDRCLPAGFCRFVHVVHIRHILPTPLTCSGQ